MSLLIIAAVIALLGYAAAVRRPAVGRHVIRNLAYRQSARGIAVILLGILSWNAASWTIPCILAAGVVIVRVGVDQDRTLALRHAPTQQ